MRFPYEMAHIRLSTWDDPYESDKDRIRQRQDLYKETQENMQGNKVNTLRGSPQSLSYCKCVKQIKICNVVDRCLARYRQLDRPLHECNTIQYHAIPWYVIISNAIPYNTIQWFAIQCNTIQWVHCNIIQFHAILYIWCHLTPKIGTCSYNPYTNLYDENEKRFCWNIKI